MRNYPEAVIGWREEAGDEVPVASILWTSHAFGWHVDRLRVEQPRDGLPLFVEFRRRWRADGRPVITFESNETSGLARIPAVLGARPWNGGYMIPDLAMVTPAGRLALAIKGKDHDGR